MTPSASGADLADSKTQIHEGNIELSVFSCWTGKLLLRAKVDTAKIDPHGKFISIDIDDDETAKPEFASSPTIDRAGLVKAVEARKADRNKDEPEAYPRFAADYAVDEAKDEEDDWFLALLNAPSSQKETRK